STGLGASISPGDVLDFTVGCESNSNTNSPAEKGRSVVLPSGFRNGPSKASTNWAICYMSSVLQGLLTVCMDWISVPSLVFPDLVTSCLYRHLGSLCSSRNADIDARDLIQVLSESSP